MGTARAGRRSRWIVRLAVVFLLSYTLLVAQNRSTERFPFFSWSLFSEVPEPEATDYAIRLLAVEGEPLLQPRYHNVRDRRAAQERRLSNLFGRALLRGRDDRAADLRDQYETTYLSDWRSVRYQVVRRDYDIRERLECPTCYLSLEVLAEYETS